MRDHLQAVLDQTGGNITHTAAILGLPGTRSIPVFASSESKLGRPGSSVDPPGRGTSSVGRVSHGAKR